MNWIQKIPAAILVLGLLCSVFHPRVFAQDLGWVVEKGKVELGYTLRWYERRYEQLRNDGLTWNANAFYLRYAPIAQLAISGEWNVSSGKSPDEQFPNRDYRSIVFGAGAAVVMWSSSKFSAVAFVNYGEALLFDRSPERHHRLRRSVITGVGLQRQSSIRRLDCSIMVSPVYVYDEATEHTLSGNRTAKSADNIGLLAGADVVGCEHVRVFVNVIYAYSWQPRIGAGDIF